MKVVTYIVWKAIIMTCLGDSCTSSATWTIGKESEHLLTVKDCDAIVKDLIIPSMAPRVDGRTYKWYCYKEVEKDQPTLRSNK